MQHEARKYLKLTPLQLTVLWALVAIALLSMWLPSSPHLVQ